MSAPRPERPRVLPAGSSRPSVAGYAVLAAVAVATFWVGYDDGGYALTSRNSLAIALLWGIVLGVVPLGWPRIGVGRQALVLGGLLGALAAWTLLSIQWADSAEKAFNEFNRVVLYLALYAFVVVFASRGRVRAWSDGLALGLAAVALLGLASRLFPQAFPEGQVPEFLPAASARLAYPVNYWNALAVVAALAIVLLLGSAVRAQAGYLRGLALAPLPALACVIYLASSRGGVLTAVVGVIVFFFLTARRLVATAAIALGAAGSTVAIAVLQARPELVEGRIGSEIVEAQGSAAAVRIALVCILAGALYAVGSYVVPPFPRVGRPVTAFALGAVLLGLFVATAAARPVQRFEEFKRMPQAEDATVTGHLLSTSGNGRYQLWKSAYKQWKTEPVLGDGAGSYEAWWAKHGTIASFALDAHSLYFETLAELGIVGFVLLLGFVAAALVLGVKRLRETGDGDRVLVAALLAAFLAFATEAAFDWMWEVPAVTGAAVACVGLLTAFARPAAAASHRARRRLFLPTGAAIVLVVGLIGSQAVPLLAATKIRDSQRAVGRADFVQAVDDADVARRVQPWAASPYLQLALVEEQRGLLISARARIERAIEHDRSDWRLWLVAARLNTKTGRPRIARATLNRARALNPRSPLFAAPPA